MKYKFLTAISLTLSLARSSPFDCRCTPEGSCWPSDREWSALNRTIQGSLVAVRPVAAACHEPDSDQPACDKVAASWTDSVWRAAEPGAVQWVNWEAWPERNQSCYVHSSVDVPCRQGRVSLYSALVASASHIQHTVNFAKKHNIRFVIKNSGHDFLGVDQQNEGGSVHRQFVPAGSHKHRAEGPAVTVEAGVSLKELYAAAGARNRTLVAGSSYTVGAAGGFIQGGGHSPIGTWKGMASDNALEFQVVTANGELVHANAYQNTDLFWALRGGGGGTFGVVVRVTIRTFPDAPTVLSHLNISATEAPAFWDAVTKFHASLPTLNDAGGSGYYFIQPQYDLNGTTVSAMALMLVFPDVTDTARVNRLYHPLISALNGTAGVTAQYGSVPFPSFSQVISTVLLPGPVGTPDETGATNLVGSRLFSRDLLVSKDGPARLIDALKSLGVGFTGHVVAGGAVAANAETVDSALNPAWRRTITHIAFGKDWEANATLAEQQAIREQVTDGVRTLRSVEGDDKMGAYLNEANAYEMDFQASFWGENYPRLYEIKQKWDPTGLFITRKGVGSEDWDDAGLCKVTR